MKKERWLKGWRAPPKQATRSNDKKTQVVYCECKKPSDFQSECSKNTKVQDEQIHFFNKNVKKVLIFTQKYLNKCES